MRADLFSLQRCRWRFECESLILYVIAEHCILDYPLPLLETGTKIVKAV